MNIPGLKKIEQLITDSNEPISVDFHNDILTLKTQKNEMYTAFSLIGILLSMILFIFYKRANMNLELGAVIFLISFLPLLNKQRINKKIVFDVTTNTITITPVFFLQRWIAQYIFKSTVPVNLKEFPKVNMGYAFKNNQSYHWIYISKGFSGITLLEFRNKEIAQAIAEVINKLGDR